MNEGMRGHGMLIRLRPRPGQEAAVEAAFTRWHATAGRVLPGTRIHLLFDVVDEPGEARVLHLFESAAAYHRLAASDAHQEWSRSLAELLEGPPEVTEVAVRWNAATGARPKVSVSIDRDVHATVEDLVARLLARHPRTPAEDAYLDMLRSIAAEYERDFPTMAPEEGEPR